MTKARMLKLTTGLGLAVALNAFGHGEESAANLPEQEGTAHHSSEKASGPVMAMDALKGKGFHAGDLIDAGAETKLLVGRNNMRAELSPHSVAEFDEKGGFRILRGSAVVENREESSVKTPGARVDFVGKAIVSYDHQEQSSSVFVLEGEARVVNAHREDSTLRLQRFHGAIIVVGDVVPQAIRQLDVGTVDGWLKGFAWPEERRKAMLRKMPGETLSAKEELPGHLNEVKIEDYFSSIDTADEQHQPNYYDKRFQDQDLVVAEQNSKQGAGKMLSPEEAALISLPKNQIDLGFELGPQFVTVEQKMKEVAEIESIKSAARAPASVAKPVALKAKLKAAKKTEQGDPDVSLVLQRLRQVRLGTPMAAPRERSNARAPASVPASAVPDPVYDYSQNF